MFDKEQERRRIKKALEKAKEQHPNDPHFKQITAACATFDLTNVGNADRLFLRHGEHLAYTGGDKKEGWIAYDGKSWQTKGGFSLAMGMAGAIARQIPFETAFLEQDPKVIARHLEHARKSGNANNARGTLEMGQPLFSEDMGLFNNRDTAAHLFNAEDGTIDLRTGEKRRHSHKDKLIGRSSIPYDPNAKAPRWERFLLEVFGGDQEIAAFVKRAVGYSLFGRQYTSNAFFLVGNEADATKNGSNGKSTFIKHLEAVLGDYSEAVKPDLICQKKSEGAANNDVAALFRARLAFGAEFDRSDILNEREFKKLTGDDPINARFLFGEFFKFYSAAVLWFSTNHIPLIQSQDHGVWRRPVIIPFFERFYRPDEDRPEGSKMVDPNLDDDLEKERQGILTWAIEGAREFWQMYKSGQGLGIPEKLTLQKQGLKEQFDPLHDFMADCVLKDPNALTTAQDLWLAFDCYQKTNGGEMKQQAFGRKLTEMGFVKEDSKGKRKGPIRRQGIRLTDMGHLYMNNTPPAGESSSPRDRIRIAS